MKTNLETQFKNANEHLRLSAAEKQLHRAELTAFLQMHPAVQKAVRSPYASLLPAFRYAFVALLVLGVGGTGITFAAEKSLPNNPLYIVKVKMSEPVQVALTTDPKKKADLEVELVDRRLKEIAAVSVQGPVDAGALALASDSLSDNIDAAQENIAALQSSEDTDTAFESAADLSSTLAAHAKILQKVQEANPAAAESIAAIAATVETETDQTDALVDATTASVENSTSASLGESTDSQQDDTRDSLTTVKEDVAAALSSFDTSDQASVTVSIDEINALIAQADAKDAAGDVKGAYLLYSQAAQKITELKTTLEADQTLGIDVIDAAATTTVTQ